MGPTATKAGGANSRRAAQRSPGWKNPNPGVGTKHLPWVTAGRCANKGSHSSGERNDCGGELSSAQPRRAAMRRAAPMGDSMREQRDGSGGSSGIGVPLCLRWATEPGGKSCSVISPKAPRLRGTSAPLGVPLGPTGGPTRPHRITTMRLPMSSCNHCLGSPLPSMAMLQVTANHPPPPPTPQPRDCMGPQPQSSPHAQHQDEAVPRLGSHTMGTEPQIPPPQLPPPP